MVKEWAGRGFKTVAQIEEYLAETTTGIIYTSGSSNHWAFFANATEEEKRIMDTWFDELGLQLKSPVRMQKDQWYLNPNINYVNTVLKLEQRGKGDRREVPRNGSSSSNHPDLGSPSQF